MVLILFTEFPVEVVPVFVLVVPLAPALVAPGAPNGTAEVPWAEDGVMLGPFTELPELVVPGPWIPTLVLVLVAPGLELPVVPVVRAPDVAIVPEESDPAAVEPEVADVPCAPLIPELSPAPAPLP